MLNPVKHQRLRGRIREAKSFQRVSLGDSLHVRFSDRGTMLTLLLAVVIACGTLGFLGIRAVRAWTASHLASLQFNERRQMRESADRKADREHEDRRIKVLEREMVLKEKQFADRPVSEPMPEWAVARIAMWEDPMAQEDERANISALYADLKNWDAVRRQLPALSPMLHTEPAAPREAMFG